MAVLERAHIQDLVTRLSNGQWPARLPFIVSLILVVLLAQQLAAVTWTLVAGRDGGVAVSTATTGQQGARAAVDPERVAGRHLFGRADANPTRIETIDAPDTQLNLQLRGILASSEASGSRVVISTPNGDERVYGPGATVPGGATVHEILPDRVLLNRRGTLETLRLPKPGDGAAPESERTAAQLTIDNLREAAAVDEQLAEIIRPQAVMVDGRLHGFRVYPGRDRQRFAALGLRAGDLIMAIDGIALNDVMRSEEALQALGGTGRITVTVQRGGQSQDIEVDLQQ